MLKKYQMNRLVFFILLSFFWTACSDDFNLTTKYKDQTITYAFLEVYNSDRGGVDTNFVVVNKAFLGEKSVSEMATVADSVNYKNYDDIKVSLQRIESIDPNSKKIGDPIELAYIKHYKDTGFFATDNNIVFYTTQPLMLYKDVRTDPSPNGDQDYYYRLSILRPGQEEVYATTKMIRGIVEEIPLNLPKKQRKIQMVFAKSTATYNIKFQSNVDARIYDPRLRIYYYEKRTNGNIYLKHLDYHCAMLVSKDKEATLPQKMEVKIPPAAFYSKFGNSLANTENVVWRAVKLSSHIFLMTLGSQDTYVYKQVSAPSNGIVQEKPIYTNITNGLGLFTSKWNYQKGGFSLTDITIDSLSAGQYTKNLKFLDRRETYRIDGTIGNYDIIVED